MVDEIDRCKVVEAFRMFPDLQRVLLELQCLFFNYL